MEKPVRIIENEKIRDFNEKVRNGLEHALNFMLSGSEEGKVQISFFEPFLMPIETYVHAYKKQSVMIKIYSENDFKGELYWFFELKTAVVLGALMRMIPLSSLEEKLQRNDFDATDQDAFGEVGNQLAGILDRAFRTLTRKNIHLRMDFKKAIYPSESVGLSSFRQEEEYVVLLTTVTIPKHGGQKLTLLLPRSLYEVMLNLEIKLEGINPKSVLIYTPDENLRDKLQLEMNSRYTKVTAALEADEILKMAEQPGVAAVGIELNKMTFPLQHQDTIFLKRLASNRTFVRLPYFLTWQGATEQQVQEVVKLGLVGATTGEFSKDFSRWALAFTQDPSKLSG